MAPMAAAAALPCVAFLLAIAGLHSYPQQAAGLLFRAVHRAPPALSLPLGAWALFLAWFLLGLSRLLPRFFGLVRPFARSLQGAAWAMERPAVSITTKMIDTCTVGNGDVLRACLLLPAGRAGPFPCVVFRTPYGASAREPTAEELAERGFAVLVQDTRGRFASEGDFVPVQDERADGRATVDWVREQVWCNGRVGVAGISYVGLSAWAAVGTAQLDAALIITSQARVKRLLVDSAGAVNLELIGRWVFLVFHLLGGKGSVWRKMLQAWRSERVEHALGHLPLRGMDSKLLGRQLTLWQEGVGIIDDFDLPYWDDKDVLNDFSRPPVPLQLIAGWYDIFKEGTFEDFSRAGPGARLLVLPSWHFGIWRSFPLVVNVTLWTFQEQLLGELQDREHKVFSQSRVWACTLGLGDQLYLPFDTWPPPEAELVEWHLCRSDLCQESSVGSWSRRYRYDPLEPTPSIGGPAFSLFNAGPKDMRPLEDRTDVLLFTSAPLPEPLLVAGRVELQLCVDVGAVSADFVGRLCDVDLQGRSENRCEGLTRMSGPGKGKLSIDLGNVCAHFAKGHRLRLHVCSGAFPRWLRNPQTGEKLAESTRTVAAWHAVCEGSMLRLPVLRRHPQPVELLPKSRWEWAARPVK